MFVQCSTKWIRNFDLSKNEYREYEQTFGGYGCEKSLPPPSAENKICEKFHEKISQLRKDENRKDVDENFVKEFLNKGPTESLLIPTEEIRFESFLTDLSFKEDYAISEQKQDLLFFDGHWEIWMVCYMSGREMICDFPRIIVFWAFSERDKEGREGLLSQRGRSHKP